MKTKKHPKANLENYSKLFVQLGLVLSLIIVYLFIQSKTFDKNVAVLGKQSNSITDDSPKAIEYEIEQPKDQIQPKKVILDIVKQIDNGSDDSETSIPVIDIDTPIDVSKIKDVPKDDIDSKDDVFDVNFMEEAPLFPGCKGNKDERKACFSEQVNKFINKKFNNELAGELGLQPGIQRIFTMFKIDKNGNIVDIEARAAHVRLQEEAIRVIHLLPKMQPGKQQGIPVKVRYSVPIVFKIE